MPDNLFQQAAVIYLPRFPDEFHLVCRFVHVLTSGVLTVKRIATAGDVSRLFIHDMEAREPENKPAGAILKCAELAPPAHTVNVCVSPVSTDSPVQVVTPAASDGVFRNSLAA